MILDCFCSIPARVSPDIHWPFCWLCSLQLDYEALAQWNCDQEEIQLLGSSTESTCYSQPVKTKALHVSQGWQVTTGKDKNHGKALQIFIYTWLPKSITYLPECWWVVYVMWSDLEELWYVEEDWEDDNEEFVELDVFVGEDVRLPELTVETYPDVTFEAENETIPVIGYWWWWCSWSKQYIY